MAANKTSVGNLMDIALDQRFQRRINYYLHLASISVINEDPTTVNHNLRTAYAKTIISGSGNIFGAAISVLTNPTIAATADSSNLPDFAILDSDIQFQINSIFNSLAGISN